MKVTRFLAGAVIGLALVAAPVASAAAEDPPAQLSITIDNDRASVDVGDELTYTLTVQNLGANPVTELKVTQSLPPGLEFGSADSAGSAADGQVTWLLSIEASSEVTVQTTMTVAKTSETVLRLASVACASAPVDAPPIVCATDSDQLPAGALVEVEKAEAADPWPSVLVVALVAGSAILVVVGLLLLMPILRRRRGAGAK